MAEGGKSLTLDISCSICFEEYQSADMPKVLSCGHTFCRKCVNKMVDRQESSLQCPKCRKDIMLPSSRDIDDLPTNFELLSIIDDQRQQEKDKYGKLEKESSSEKAINQCMSHKVPTNFLCKSCKKWVCAECLQEDHTPDKHTIFSKSVTSSHFVAKLTDEICRLDEQLKHFYALNKKDNSPVAKVSPLCKGGDKSPATEEKKILKEEPKSFRQALERSLDELVKTTAACKATFLDLKVKNCSTLSSKIHKNCTFIQEKCKTHTSSQGHKLEELLSCIQHKLKVDIKLLQKTCQKIPAEVDVKFRDTFQKHSTSKQAPTKLAGKAKDIKSDTFSFPKQSRKTSANSSTPYAGVKRTGYFVPIHFEEDNFFEESDFQDCEEYVLNDAAQYEDEYEQDLIDSAWYEDEQTEFYAAQYEAEQAENDAAWYEDEQTDFYATQYEEEQAENDAWYEDEQTDFYATQCEEEQAEIDAAQYEDEETDFYATQCEEEQAEIDAAQYEDERTDFCATQYEEEQAEIDAAQYEDEQTDFYATQYEEEQAEIDAAQYEDEQTDFFATQYEEEQAEIDADQYEEEYAFSNVDQYEDEFSFNDGGLYEDKDTFDDLDPFADYVY